MSALDQFHFDPDDIRQLADTFAATTSTISALGLANSLADGVTDGLAASRVLGACGTARAAIDGAMLRAAANMQTLGDTTDTAIAQFLTQDSARAAGFMDTGLDLP
ncbi:hypothetical protein ACWEPH_22130 [Nocardia beijingensis]|uniref:hypothetical protein n=1 Tax=Nocardia beijingensis TaxID=95162 RepID=UPI0018953A2F|nr:hypothetical protein [Nocardia beijingensis]MBF6076973.1 hypothetical protein [Nocardia beijingensis]